MDQQAAVEGHPADGLQVWHLGPAEQLGWAMCSGQHLPCTPYVCYLPLLVLARFRVPLLRVPGAAGTHTWGDHYVLLPHEVPGAVCVQSTEAVCAVLTHRATRTEHVQWVVFQ